MKKLIVALIVTAVVSSAIFAVSSAEAVKATQYLMTKSLYSNCWVAYFPKQEETPDLILPDDRDPNVSIYYIRIKMPTLTLRNSLSVMANIRNKRGYEVFIPPDEILKRIEEKAIYIPYGRENAGQVEIFRRGRVIVLMDRYIPMGWIAPIETE